MRVKDKTHTKKCLEVKVKTKSNNMKNISLLAQATDGMTAHAAAIYNSKN